MSDLGDTICGDLRSNSHIDQKITKACKSLSFMMRFTTNFTYCETLINLNKTLVRSALKYCSIIWTLYTLDNILKIDSVQQQFLRLQS